MTIDSLDVVNKIAQLEYTLDYFWTAFSGIVVIFMQLGFAFLEGGCVRFKSMQSIMIKVFLNTCIAFIFWWLCGYGIAMGHGDFIGDKYYIGQDMRDNKHFPHWVLQASVGAAANSIVSGGAVERMTIPGYCLVSVVFSAFIYPVCVHWTWGGGWLQQLGYIDLAGSGTIHFMSAVGALVITVMLKPRKGRWERPDDYAASNTVYICLACLSLYTCWIFFNAGGVVALAGDAAYAVGRATTNTMISGASGGLTVMALHYFMNRKNPHKFSLIMICNGQLAGLVAVTGSCDGIELWAAFVIGVMGGITYVGCANLLHHLQVDDPVDAFPIHGACGALGAQFPGWFNTQKGILYGHSPEQWGVQLLGTVVWLGWSAAFHIVICVFLKIVGAFRVSEEDEIAGLDFSQCGGAACCPECLPPIEEISPPLSKVNIQTNGSAHKKNLLTQIQDEQQQIITPHQQQCQE